MTDCRRLFLTGKPLGVDRLAGGDRRGRRWVWKKLSDPGIRSYGGSLVELEEMGGSTSPSAPPTLLFFTDISFLSFFQFSFPTRKFGAAGFSHSLFLSPLHFFTQRRRHWLRGEGADRLTFYFFFAPIFSHFRLFTFPKSSSGLFIPTCLENMAMSSLKDSVVLTSPPATEGSRGVHVASSHFSKIRASRGNRGCLQYGEEEE